MEALLLELQAEFASYLKQSTLFDRKIHIPKVPKKIKTLIGMRRSGKTHALLQMIQQWVEDGVSLSRILYLNFEDDRLFPTTLEKLQKLIDIFYELYPENYNQTCYLVFDEIQVVEEWYRLVRRLLDTKSVEIYLTGSSAKLLSSEISTTLRGRSYAIEVFPLSFYEYLRFKKQDYKPSSRVVGQQKAQIKKQLTSYLHCGGFPEVVHADLIDRQRILQDYVNVVIFRDIIERHKIDNLKLIRYLISIVLKNVGNQLSLNKLYNDIKSQGILVGKDTLYSYLSYIEDAYLAFSVPLYSESIRKVETNPKKIYAVDPGLANTYSLSPNKNYGHLFENLIYLDLRRAGCEIYYYLTEDRYEVDFLARTPDGKLKLFQVAWDVSNSETLDREMRALKQAEMELGIKGLLITPEIYIKLPSLMAPPI